LDARPILWYKGQIGAVFLVLPGDFLMKYFATASLLVVILLQFMGTLASAAINLDIRPLLQSREALTPTAYSPAERELMAKQALMFIKNLYVHRQLKIADFGQQVDPVPRLEDMVRRASSMNDIDFHVAMQKIFLDLHDFHTNYVAPLPLRCSYVLAPLRFRDVYDDGVLKIIVSGKTKVLKNFAPEVARAVVGDELIAVNDQPIQSVFAKLKSISGGANPEAMTANAIIQLSMIPLSGNLIPEENDLKYTLKRGATTYDISSKYFALINEASCVSSVSGEPRRPNINRGGRFENGENPIIRDYKRLVLPVTVAPFSEEETLPVGKIYTIDTPAGKLLKFDLESFVPTGDESADGVIQHVKVILQNNQSTTSALIIDLRSNGGGLITLAEGLTQLFTPNAIETMPVRLLPNQLNLSMFLNSNQGNENGWSSDTRVGMSNASTFTIPRSITSTQAANRYGQIWFKPVVILTDANCYSACDSFAAAMQDHGAATIIGTHATTGAGGANVMDYETFQSIFAQASPNNNPFLKLPGSQSMRVSWRQTIRVGKNQGKLIEDAGVKSDKVVRYVTSDVIDGESRALMRQVHTAIGAIIPRYKSNIQNTSSLTMANGEAAKWGEKVAGVDTIEVLFGTDIVQSIPVSSTASHNIQVDLQGFHGEWSENSFQVVGLLRGVVQFRVVRKVLWRGEALSAGIEWKENFNAPLQYWHATQIRGEQNEGWQIKDNILRVGLGPNYRPNIISQVFASVETEGKEFVSLDLAMGFELESDMDFVNIIVRDPSTGDEAYIASLSGSGTIASAEKIKIPVNGAKRLEVVFEFTSDENWHMKGPEISKLSIEAN
jgi:Peptidase family S41